MFSLGLITITILSCLLILSATCRIVGINPEKAVATPSSYTASQQDEEGLRTIEIFQNGFCGVGAKPNSTEYVIII